MYILDVIKRNVPRMHYREQRINTRGKDGVGGDESVGCGYDVMVCFS